MKIFSFMISVSFLVLSVGCQKNSGGATESSESVVVAETIFANELSKLKLAEDALATKGLKFKSIHSEVSADRSFEWEKNLVHSPKELAPDELLKFIDLAENFLNHFSKPFFVRIEKENTLLHRQLKSDFIMNLVGKIALARKSLEKN